MEHSTSTPTSKITFRKDFGRGYWWPDYDWNPEKCFSIVQNHLTDMDPAIELCKGKKAVIQAGGHAGLWPEKLSKIFEKVYTFEPDNELYECMKRNTAGIENILSWPFCLGSEEKDVWYKPERSAGSGHILQTQDAAGYTVSQLTIDLLAPHMEKVDLILLDVEGYEWEILKGAKELIARDRPIIMLEPWRFEDGNFNPEQEELMKTIGYTFNQRSGRDFIYTPE